MMTLDEAIRTLRNDPDYSDLVRDAYLGPDAYQSAIRFYESAEFLELKKILTTRITGAVVLDLGAGTGIASYAFVHSGAAKVFAVEPDPSYEVGRGAIQRSCANLPVEIIDAFAERLPLPDNCVDIFYGRQVLHHIRDLSSALHEAQRVLKPGGIFIACREHVIDNDQQLELFLGNHPVHRLAGGENAYTLSIYLNAIRSAPLAVKRIITPLGSIINAFPSVRSNAELQILQHNTLKKQFGLKGTIAADIPLIRNWLLRYPEPVPGRFYSFVAVKKP